MPGASAPAPRPLARRNPSRDLLALTALCAVVYALGLTIHGLTNWQEAQRALVAREMQARDAWITPTVRGEPYLAKPPMIYWAQRALAAPTGRTVGAFELRLTVALAGWLGVIATYLLARRLLHDPSDPGEHEDAAWADHAAWWSALMLATGILYVRSSRIGELDILLVPFTLVAIGAIAAAWRRHRESGRQHPGAIALAAAAAAGATLTKGPPGLLVIALASYGGIMLHAARHAPRPPRTAAALAAATLVALGFALHNPPTDAGAWLGAALAALLAALSGWMLAGVGGRSGAWAALRALHRTHPVIVLGVGAAALWLWGWLVKRDIGAEAVTAAAAREAADNLRLLVPDSARINLEAAAYAVGAGSIAAIIAVVWLAKDRPRLTPGRAIVIAWVLLGLLAFSLLGKGVPRYLTPVWPGIALLGGMWLASALRDLPRPALLRRGMGVAVALLAIGQAGWYAVGRERLYADRAPRALIAELARPELEVDPSRLGVLDYWSPALDFYAGQPVELFRDAGPESSLAGVPATPIAQLAQRLARTGESYTLLVRETPHPETDTAPPTERLTTLGLAVQTLPIAAEHRIDNRRTRLIAVRVWAVGPIE